MTAVTTPTNQRVDDDGFLVAGVPSQADVQAFVNLYAKMEETADRRHQRWAKRMPHMRYPALNPHAAVFWQLDGNTADGFAGLIGRWDADRPHLGWVRMPWRALTATDDEFEEMLRK